MVVSFGFIRERIAPDIVALSAVGALLSTAILGADDVLAVFSNSAPITVAAMFVLSAGLERTDVIDWLGRHVTKAGGQSPFVALAMLMASVMVLSAFINNTPVVVTLIPIVINLATALDLAPTKLLTPLSSASIFGGTTTLIGTSTNILVDDLAQRQGLAPFGRFEITAAGAVMGAVGVVYLLLLGRWLLPNWETLASLLPRSEDRHFFADVIVPFESPLIDKGLKDVEFKEERGLRVIDRIRQGVPLRGRLDEADLGAAMRADSFLEAGDVAGSAVWRRGLKAIKEIWREEPRKGEAVN